MTKTNVNNKQGGFTLIELSIVLVIIGLIVGGVLVGQDLIRAAEVRAQVSQIEKLNTGVNTFRGKFNAIPGDMAYSVAVQFGFTTGTSCDGSAAGRRDGNGLIDGATATSGTTIGGIAGYEAGLIWQDLSSSTGGNLIEGSVTGVTCASTTLTATGLTTAFPAAKIGRGQYLTAYNYSSTNWWGLFGFGTVSAGAPASVTTPMSVMQAYNIDKKMDDGIASSGNVVAQYINGSNVVTVAPSSASATTTTCYETTGGTYNIGTNNGGGSYCALGFRFQ